jgi:prepilin-type N-terminal cleavage/methylation domain-containing protein
MPTTTIAHVPAPELRPSARRGFTLIELMIVLAVIAIVSAIAIPQLSAARVTANESSAVATLRSLASAQALVSASGAIDTDFDGCGEYAYLGELSGAIPLRIGLGGGVVGPGTLGIDELAPACMSSAFANVGGGVITKSGYVFQLWIAGPSVLGAVSAVAEDATGGKLLAPFTDPQNAETYWCAYAWPVDLGETGRSTYFISNDGQTLTYRNTGVLQYAGVLGGPASGAAYTVAGDMSAPLALGGVPGSDGNVWVVLN